MHVNSRITSGLSSVQALNVNRFVFSPLFCAAARPLTVLALIKGYGLDLNAALTVADAADCTDMAAHYELTGH